MNFSIIKMRIKKKKEKRLYMVYVENILNEFKK